MSISSEARKSSETATANAVLKPSHVMNPISSDIKPGAI